MMCMWRVWIWHRSELYDRINRRVHMMLQQGLAEEVRNLLNSGVSPESQSMRGIGYKEMVNYVRGTGTLEQAVDDIKKGTRHFAKRQLTWYRKMPYVHWYHPALYRERGLVDNVSWNIARFFKG